MSLLGEMYARCGPRRTRREYEGRPTCEACAEMIEAGLTQQLIRGMAFPPV